MSLMVWVVFFALYLSVLALDLVVLHRESKEMSVRQALGWTVVWVLVALSFSALVYGVYEHHWFGWRVTPDAPSGTEAALQYITGYLLEWSLSVDNIFVIAIIFTYMKIPPQFQYRVLFWGIVGAILLRGAMIAAGAALIHSFDWMFYVFGAILLLSAARMLKSEEEQFDPGKSVLVRLARRVYPVTDKLDGERFFTMVDGARHATPLFVTLLLVDFADVVFAVDSIPAIFAVTQEPFIVFTSNAFAILGLRSLYFAIAGLMMMFKYIKFSLIFILAFVGVKMMLHHHLEIPHAISLGVIVGFLAIGIVASLWVSRREAASGTPDLRND
ncbi:membrane protein [Steroidobacter agaridevorans]|uniref:Membrane protein n=1 Tax=Steroidobacter agaridevorans TaxID=2695856 RepID=A0A829YCM2_9GAMM|nr:TerC family protein [Steroidobacter agaridevorans]GFE80362.1 membrane protein [Steroidobacter agaridevorans]GFE87417.1 membrane protein [Steroidobacter agaridevorans]